MARAILYVILDGVGDTPVAERGGRTPLEEATTPHLDRLVEKGIMGQVYTVRKGIAPESDAGVFSLLSYNPLKFNLSRGVVEALGSDIDFRDGDLALRCNFATVENGRLVDRRVGRNLSTEEAKELARAINDDLKLRRLCDFELKATIGHRCSLVLRGNARKLSEAVSNLDPAYEKKGKVTIAKTDVVLPAALPECIPLSRGKRAGQTAELLNEFVTRAHRVLDAHKVNAQRRGRGDRVANYLLMRDAGTKLPRVRSLHAKFGLRSIALADMPVELGIAKVVGMDTVVFPPSRTLEGYKFRARKAVEFANEYGLIYVHLKGPDEPGHDGDFEGKKKSIEDIDAGFFASLTDLEDVLVCVTSDHATPCNTKGHTDDPVPILIAGPRVPRDGSRRFTEYSARLGRLGTVRHGYEILRLLRRYSR